VIDHFRRSYWIFRVTSCPESGELRPFRLIVILGAIPFLTILTAWWEGTLYLVQQGGRGLFEHVGWWAQYLSCPILVIFALQVIRSFATILVDPRFVGPRETDLDPRTIQTALLRRCCGETGSAKRQIAELIALGGASVIINLQTTRTAIAVYGEDVWDSSLHQCGYWIGKLFLLFEWAYLLPLLAFVAFSIGAAIHYVVKRAVTGKVPQLSVFAADGCGGYSPLGQLMLQIVYLDVPIMVTIVCFHFTHNRHFYFTIVFATAFLLITVAAQLFLPFIPLHEGLVQLKQSKLKELEEFLSRQDRDFLYADRPAIANAIMAGACVYKQTLQLSTWPYARADTWKALTPFLPVASLFLRFALK
jgi:hypothetical protein